MTSESNEKHRPFRVRRGGRAVVAALLAALPWVAACGSDFDPGSRVTTLRVLAVQADKPWAAPGETVALRSLWIDPVVPARPIQWAWSMCVNPPSSTVVGCFAKIAADASRTQAPPPLRLVNGTDPTASEWSVTVPADAISSLPEAGRPAAMLGIVFVACPGTIQLDTTSSADSARVPIQCIGEGGRSLRLDEFEMGIKRIFLRDRDRNANPVIESVTWDGQPWPESEVKTISAACSENENRFDRCSGPSKPKIALRLAPASFERGPYQDEAGAEFTEQLVAQYYATEGLFEFDVRRAESPETAFAARKAGEITMWFIARDNRGGMAWETRRVRVQ